MTPRYAPLGCSEGQTPDLQGVREVHTGLASAGPTSPLFVAACMGCSVLTSADSPVPCRQERATLAGRSVLDAQTWPHSEHGRASTRGNLTLTYEQNCCSHTWRNHCDPKRKTQRTRNPRHHSRAAGRELTRLHGGAIDGHAAPPGRATERLARRAACHPVRPWQGRVMTGQKDARPGNHTRSGQRTVNPPASIPARQAERNPSWY